MIGDELLVEPERSRAAASRLSRHAMIAQICASRSTGLIMSTGAVLDVAGSPQEAAKLLQDAVRSSPGTLAWFDDVRDATPIGVNPAHVVVVSAVALDPES
ncbi:MAG TPA: hypothetical protein VFZ00_14145 [Solirubrobacter sp.]|nr:hypothetical protein [Solirubrobacter sp.]